MFNQFYTLEYQISIITHLYNIKSRKNHLYNNETRSKKKRHRASKGRKTQQKKVREREF